MVAEVKIEGDLAVGPRPPRDGESIVQLDVILRQVDCARRSGARVLQVNVDSSGGDVLAALAIYDALRSQRSARSSRMRGRPGRSSRPPSAPAPRRDPVSAGRLTLTCVHACMCA
jgi:hypothetical protein